MEPTTNRRAALSIERARVGRDGCAFGDGMAHIGHGQAWIPPRKGCG
ncbi:MAG TPA: hypothetical protein VE953_25510 [Terriglobales bacterium]|nr:hypothetical protein [Terriglobales bacterium]